MLACPAAANRFFLRSGSSVNSVSSSGTDCLSKCILNELASCGIKPDGALFCGDYTRYGRSSNIANNKSDVKRGIDQLKSLTTSTLGVKESNVHWIFAQGNHDVYATTEHGLSKGGANDPASGAYGVYVLNNNDYGWTTDGNMAGNTELIEKERQEMKAYFDAKINGDNIAVNAGTYNTNKSAKLYYKNYLGKDCTKDTVSPELSWDSAKVNYAFYLVDEKGDIISDEATGTTTDNFNDRTAVVDPTLFAEFDLNTTSADIKSSELYEQLAAQLEEQGYELYVYDKETEQGVTYNVDANSGNGGGSWSIEGDSTGTTYVTGHNGDAYSNDIESQNQGNYSNTTVWFAVVSMIDCVPDTVVVDFGLPVEIDVTANDKLIGTNGTLAGIGLSENRPANSRPKNGSNQSLQAGFGAALNEGLNYGTAKIENGKVVYSLETMEMNDAEDFYYAMQYAGETGAKGYYYSTVTVIPATTIYYEDGFVTYSIFNMDGNAIADDWTSDGTSQNPTQAQDRPGADENNALGNLDADNIYGYDGEYADKATYSMGSAKKVTVNPNQFAEAQFTFSGTGFDIVSLTSNLTGTITVSVYKTSDFIRADGSNNYSATAVKTYMVDTYYGYEYNLRKVTYEWDITPDHPDGHWVRVNVEEPPEGATAENTAFPANPKDGERFTRVENTWIVDTDANNALYQVPVENSYFMTTKEGAEAAVASLMMMRPPVAPEEPDVPENNPPVEDEQDMFEPKRFDVRLSKDRVKVGQKVTVTVTTGKDVEYITVNGSKVTKYSGRRHSNTRTWEVQVKAEEAGELDVAVVCYNREKLASKAVVKTVNVAPKNKPDVFKPKRFDVRLSDSSVKVGSKVTVTVTTGKDVEYITINGSKVTKHSGRRHSNTRTWKVRVEAKEAGELDLAVVCYNNKKLASEAVVKTVTVTEKYTNINNAVTDRVNGIFDRFWGRK